MEGKAIFVDFDECLIHGFHAGDNKEPSFDQLKKSFETAWIPDEGETYAIIIRPGAREFLQALKKITPHVFILTAGTKGFQTEVAKAAGLLDLVNGLYGRDSTDVPQFTSPVLIDDLWIKTPNTFHKAKQMGIIEPELIDSIKHGPWNQNMEAQVEETISKHYIQIPHFIGNLNDKGFAEVLPKVAPKLEEIEKESQNLLKERIISTFTESKVKES